MQSKAEADRDSMLGQAIKTGVKETETEQISKPNFTPLVPDDHGAYGMLLVPLVIGLIVGAMQGITANVMPALAFPLLTLALLAAFFSHAPLEVLSKPNVNAAARQRAQFWLAVYLMALAVCGLTLVLAWQLWGLIWFALPASIPLIVDMVARKWRKQRSLGVRLIGIIGLVLSAPAAYYVATGKFDLLALALWIVNLVYFGSSLFYVRIWFEAKKREKTRQPGQSAIPDWLLQVTSLYHATGAALIAGLIVTGILPWMVALAFVPLLIKLIMALRRPPTYISIKRVGLYEFAQSFVFALLLVLSLR